MHQSRCRCIRCPCVWHTTVASTKHVCDVPSNACSGVNGNASPVSDWKCAFWMDRNRGLRVTRCCMHSNRCRDTCARSSAEPWILGLVSKLIPCNISTRVQCSAVQCNAVDSVIHTLRIVVIGGCSVRLVERRHHTPPAIGRLAKAEVDWSMWISMMSRQRHRDSMADVPAPIVSTSVREPPHRQRRLSLTCNSALGQELLSTGWPKRSTYTFVCESTKATALPYPWTDCA
jgi:hypothetical protein